MIETHLRSTYIHWSHPDPFCLRHDKVGILDELHTDHFGLHRAKESKETSRNDCTKWLPKVLTKF